MAVIDPSRPESVRRTLQWRLSWKDVGGTYREKTFTDIDELKKARTAVKGMQLAGLISELSTVQRYVEIPATPWVQPTWVRGGR